MTYPLTIHGPSAAHGEEPRGRPRDRPGGATTGIIGIGAHCDYGGARARVLRPPLQS
ncbi:hypothetical protein [Pararhodobacter oceanensis]|uniref:hypothetical protein n=1 Tax=Pararhodobacter oceanensis TaxID=2172121 RepID=UPI003A8DFDE6